MGNNKGSKGQKEITRNIELPAVERADIAFRIVGQSPLIVHRFEEKAITEMLAKQRGFIVEKQAKDPTALFEAAKYRNMKGEDCLPVMMVKKAMTEAATFSDDLTKKLTRGAFFIYGEYTPLKFELCEKRLDVVRLSGMSRTADVRFRPEYREWSADIVVNYNPRLISLEQLVYLLREAGTAIGVGEWRPQRDGNFGTFDIKVLPSAMVADIKRACSVPRQPLELPEWVLREFDDDPQAAATEAKQISEGKSRKRKPNGHTEGEQTPPA